MNIKNVSLTSSLSPRFAVTVLFRRKLLTLRQLSHEQNICFYFADASARTSSDTTSTWCVCGTQKVRGVQSSSGALKHLALKCKSEMFSCVSLTNLHTRHVVIFCFYTNKQKAIKNILK